MTNTTTNMIRGTRAAATADMIDTAVSQILDTVGPCDAATIESLVIVATRLASAAYDRGEDDGTADVLARATSLHADQSWSADQAIAILRGESPYQLDKCYVDTTTTMTEQERADHREWLAR